MLNIISRTRYAMDKMILACFEIFCSRGLLIRSNYCSEQVALTLHPKWGLIVLILKGKKYFRAQIAKRKTDANL